MVRQPETINQVIGLRKIEADERGWVEEERQAQLIRDEELAAENVAARHVDDIFIAVGIEESCEIEIPCNRCIVSFEDSPPKILLVVQC